MRSALVALALLLAGCSDAPASKADVAIGTDTMATTGVSAEVARNVTVPAAVAVSWSGHTKEGAWVCMEQAGTGQCPAGQQVQPDGAHVTAIPYEGNLTGVDVEMSWQPDPTQTGLILAAYGNTSAGRTLLAYVQGPPPIGIMLDAAALSSVVPDDAVVLMVWPQGKTPTSPSLFVDATQQPFAVEGLLMTSVRAEAVG